MATHPLPDHPNLDQLRRRAKELRDAARAGDPAALDRIGRHLDLRPGAAVTLSAAQLVLAREYGFASWPRLKAEVEARTMGLVERVDAFLAASVEGRTGRATRLLTTDPRVADFDIATAAVLGDVSGVRDLIAADPAVAVNPDSRRGWPPLLYVCHSRWHLIDPGRADGMLAVARVLLDAGASPDSHRAEGRTGHASALYGAAGIANNPEITRLLLERGANPNDGESLYHAVYNADHRCLRLLVDFGAAAAGTNALPAALGRGNVEAVRILLSAGADPGRPHPGEPAPTGLLPDLTINPLPAAAATDSPAVVEALLAAGADPNALCRDGRSPLSAAVRHGAAEVAELLVRYGAADDADDIDHFIGACMHADRAAVDRILAEQPGLPGRLTDTDHAALVDAAEDIGAEPVALMLDLGFPITVHRAAATALHAAAYRGRAELVRLLLARGADLDQRDLHWHATALAWATVGSGERPPDRTGDDWAATVEALLEAGSSRDGAWVTGKPPSEDVAALLARYGIGEHDEPPAPPPPIQHPASPATGPAATRRVAERLRAAFDSADGELLASVLHPDVRWGEGPAGCRNRNQVLEHYQVLRARGVTATVSDLAVHGDAVVLGLAVTRPGGVPHPDHPDTFYQVFRVADGAVIGIRNHPDRDDALASIASG